MGRPQKQTVDYFPHDAVPGKTIFILQSRYGNNGYAAWFKLLALLCRTPGHAYYAQKPADWQFLVAEMAFPEGEIMLVLDCLAELDAIDFELWQNKIIWATGLMPRIADAYKDRIVSLPVKPTINPVSPPINPVSPSGYPQSKVKEIKVNKTEEKESEVSPNGNEHAKEIWGKALETLRVEVNKSNYHSWLKDTEGVSIEGDILVVRAPLLSQATYLRNNMISLLEKHVCNQTDQPARRISVIS